jgi:cell fate regulator YaaT (PSP1 superfamily)
MSIFPLPVFEADADPHQRAAMSDEEIYARLEPPKTIVVKFGVSKLVGEFPYDGPSKPGCGSKLVARTFRGTEIVEMLTTTCSNSGCGKSISRNEMLDYIENSGGKDYPFYQKGRIMRVATIDDLNRQSALEPVRQECIKFARQQIAELNLKMKLVEAEPVLGGEVITFYYMAEERIDFRELVQRLASQFKTRIEMRQVGARDEARLVADYERCGQHCCCKNFLKVLKPVSMRSAKVQKATLDPLKISGRCGRLMCCLRYEDQTYKELKSKLPPRNKRVGTSEGPGIVVDSKILVQLVLVRLEHDPTKEIAVPVEELMDPETCPKPGETKRLRDEQAMAEADPFRGMSIEKVVERTGEGAAAEGESEGESPRKRRRRRKKRDQHAQQDAFREQTQREERRRERPPRPAGPQQPSQSAGPRERGPASPGQPQDQDQSRRKRRRRRRRGRGGDSAGSGPAGEGPPPQV